jgi:hypothetical protein
MEKSNIIKYKFSYFFKRLKDFQIIASFSNRNLDLGFRNGIKNRKQFLSNLGINYKNLVCVKQPHKSKIIIVNQIHKGRGALNYRTAISGADGLVTNKKMLPLAVFTADCLSIFLFCPKTETIGLIHAGWRGSKEGIARRAISILKDKFNCNPKDIIVAFGPTIRCCCYKVGNSFKKYFKDYLIKRKNKLFLDLIKINKDQFISCGVKKKNIIDSNICTSCQNNNFFSYRREKKEAGRIISVIMLTTT